MPNSFLLPRPSVNAGSALAEFVALQPRLFAIAYRMLGSVSDADDVVQDTWLRWERASLRARSAEAMLVTIATRLSLDRLRAGQRRRKEHVGPWLPEPLMADQGAPDPGEVTVLHESMGMAFLTMLERLSGPERAALLLHDVFGYPHAEVALMIDESVANSRQLVSRARRRLGDPHAAAHPRPPVEVANDMVLRFIVAASSGDVSTVMSLCAPDVSLVSDGGPHRRAARYEVVTPHRVSRLWTNITKRRLDRPGPPCGVEFGRANGDVAMSLRYGDRIDFVAGFRCDLHGVRQIWIVLDPAKLRHLHAPARTWRVTDMSNGAGTALSAT